MFGRKKPSTDNAAPLPPAPSRTGAQQDLGIKAPTKADDDIPPMPAHLRAVGKPALPTTNSSVNPGAVMSDTPTPSFRPEIAKRPSAELPKAAVQATAQATASGNRSEGHPEAKVLMIGREISLSGQITACDRVIVEGKVEAQLTDSRFVEVSETGQFKGSAEVEEAEIRGRFEGRLSVRGRLLIRGSGKVSGEIAYGQVEIECGGEISGTVQTVAAGSRPASSSSAAAE
jgi:cytoskeletal protein CcmA (bactofilin family)